MHSWPDFGIISFGYDHTPMISYLCILYSYTFFEVCAWDITSFLKENLQCIMQTKVY